MSTKMKGQLMFPGRIIGKNFALHVVLPEVSTKVSRDPEEDAWEDRKIRGTL
jgi:hypothetical protein